MDTLNIEKYGFNHTGNIFRNNPPGALVEKALLHKEGRLSRAGALCTVYKAFRVFFNKKTH